MRILGIDNKKVQFLMYAIFSSFGTYFCMYAFRKPFTAATFENLYFLGLDYKIVLVITQVIGYMMSKFSGIKLISELQKKWRLPYLIAMILIAEVSLLFFAIVPHRYSFIFMFCNGLSLGMVWGVVFSYIEGRKVTEILGVVLCSSFIVSSGVVKSVGLWVVRYLEVPEVWMPAVTGAIFLLPFILFSFLLEHIPEPTVEDRQFKQERIPMITGDRKKVLIRFGFPLIILVTFYVFLTAIRDFRDNFSREIWDALGYQGDISVYTLSELPIAIIVLILFGFFTLIKDNYRAFISYHYLLCFGTLLVGLSSYLFQSTVIGPELWMILIGLGLYISYVPFNGIFFDRMIATFHIKGNAGFLIYIVDAFGYLGSIIVLVYKNLGHKEQSWLTFFTTATYLVSVLGFIISLVSLFYFKRKNVTRFKITTQPISNITYE